MLKDRTFFILSLMKFDGLASTNFNIARELAKHNEVYYVEHPLTYNDLRGLSKDSPEYLVRKDALKAASDGLLPEKVDGVNVVISRPVLPINFLPPGAVYNFLNRVNERIVARRIKNIVKARGIKEYLFLNIYDFRFPGINSYLQPLLNIYYCVDPIVGEYDRKHGVAAEEILIKNADLVICTSRALQRQKMALNSHTFFVPNGADIVSAVNRVPDKSGTGLFDHVKRPVIGYIGAIERRIDYDWIRSLSARRPEWTFVFVGPVYKEHVPDWFFSAANIKVLPPVPYNSVSEVIKGFDVCMIPFKKDAISDTIFPLKLFEYLGLGKPVVITDFNEDLAEFTGNVVSFSKNVDAFEQALEAALQESGKDKTAARIAVALENTWEDRVNRIAAIIEAHLTGNGQPDKHA